MNISFINNSIIKAILKLIYRESILYSNAVIAISKWLANKLRKINKRTYLVPDAFEDEIFMPAEKNYARKVLNITQNEKIVMYSGLKIREGFELILDAAEHLRGINIYILGGRKKDLEQIKKIIKRKALKNIKPIGRVKINKVPLYLNASDVLVLPYAKTLFNEYFTSPLKLFEYMAVKKPIVSTNIGCVKGILRNNYNAIIVEPNHKDLANAIKMIFNNKKLAEKIAENAYKTSKKYTYKKRAEKIKNILNNTQDEYKYDNKN